ncbi:hypothetical protein Taro_020467 [Colocasia esculenta]|uniref:Ubiquitin-like protease family profile domain-containing protein n=1 Tax=Colocasia esculenta TaxID=4460 RepID=A0A843UWI0_COLES|nr:hypothetical protein [Colocasia esculenta]
MASCRSPTSAEIGRIAEDVEQQALMAMEVEETSLQVEEEEQKRKEEEQKRRKEEEEAERKKKEEEQKRKEEEEEGAERKKKEEEEEEKERKRRHISPSSLSRRVTAGTRKRRQLELYMVEELRSYMKGKHIDAENWSLRYPDPCPQQGSGDDCAIFTCKYMECLARRDTQGLPFSQDDMPTVRAKFTLHFIKAYFNA